MPPNTSAAVKGRFDGLDVTAEVSCLSNLLGRRVVNIYDGASGNEYVFKLQGTSSMATEYLVVESGIRFHTQRHFQSQTSMPSPYCAKLRKHLRGLRLEQMFQVGRDRVVVFQFGTGPSRHALILELYSKGNLILTDSNYTILALLRSHVYKDETTTAEAKEETKTENVAVQVGHVYPVSYATTYQDETAETTEGVLTMSVLEGNAWIQEQLESKSQAKGKKKSSGLTLKTLLLKPTSGVSHYGPALIEHCILSAKLTPHTTLTTLSESEWTQLQTALQNGRASMQALRETIPRGYILYQPREDVSDNKDMSLPHADKVLLEFQPHLLLQHEGRDRLEYDTFDAAVDDFFTHLTTQKRLQKALSAQAAAESKLQKIQNDQKERLVALEAEQKLLHRHAEAVRWHADEVDKALTVINSALDSGMDWDQLEQLVQVEQQNGNPVALLISKLELEQDAMILQLQEEDENVLDVRISLKESAHANANTLFGKYRASKEKSQKTIEASTKALKAAEESAQRQLAQAQTRGTQLLNRVARKPLWFEKFYWFITSDNYLCLGGRDAHQNELLVKRYLRPGDAYLHADVHGAASCILRAKRRRRTSGKTELLPLSEHALREAGNFTICRSSAWASRMVTSAWWVESHQVSKTAPTGEYLSVGSFMVRGKKNFLPPTPLEMGLAVLFRLSDDDADGIARHQNERRDFMLMELENADKEDDESKGSVVEPEVKPLPKSKQPKPVSPEPEKTLVDSEGNSMEPSTEQAKAVLTETGASDDETNNVEKDKVHSTSSNEEDSEDGKQSNFTEEASKKKEKKGLSVRDRKLIRKYGSLEEAERVIAAREQDDGVVGEDQEEVSVTSTNVSASTNAQGATKRGKKAKMKRAKKKYGDQDGEDRELAMLALQGGEKNKKKGGAYNKGLETETQRKVAAETTALLVKDPSESALKLPDDVRSILAECVTVKRPEDDLPDVRWDKFDADTLDQLVDFESKEAQLAAAKRLLALKKSTRVDNFSSSLGGILRTIRKYGYENLDLEPNDPAASAQRKTKERRGTEASEWKQTMAEEGVIDLDLDEDAVDDTVELSKLTSKPHAEDLLLYAVPVCAPYQTLSQYAFRAKLTPGNMKRGKAAKQCVDMFLKGDSGKTTPSTEGQKELIKKVSDNDWVQVICSDVKISAAGASKANKKQKANNKKSKKKKG